MKRVLSSMRVLIKRTSGIAKPFRAWRRLSPARRVLAAAAALLLLVTGMAAIWGTITGDRGSNISAPLRAELTQISLDYVKGTGEGDLAVYVPRSYLEWLTGMGGGPVVATEDNGPWGVTEDALDPYASEKTQITWFDSSGQEKVFSIPFDNLVILAEAGEPVLNKRIDFQMNGSPSGYPGDRWVISLDAAIRWPDFVKKPVVGPDESEYQSDLVVTAANISAFHPRGETGKLELARPLATQLLLYSVALAPLLLAFAAWVSRQRASSGTIEAPLELAAALISIFALRSVLVPAELPGLTRIDYLLAVETVAIIGATALAAAFRPTPTAKT